LFREILPNISGSVVADAGPRLAGAFLIIAALNYLGIGVNPPAPDWGAMIFENRSGLTVQPWPVAAPIIMIVALTISLNLLGDAIARNLGRSVDATSGR
jgi:peptide/nickel transport system permease protein